MKRATFILFPFFLLFFSCQSSKNLNVAVPEVSYPDFPVNVNDSAVKIALSDDGQNVVIDYLNEGKQVTMPMWFWVELVEYAVDVNSAIEQYKAIVEVLNSSR